MYAAGFFSDPFHSSNDVAEPLCLLPLWSWAYLQLKSAYLRVGYPYIQHRLSLNATLSSYMNKGHSLWLDLLVPSLSLVQITPPKSNCLGLTLLHRLMRNSTHAESSLWIDKIAFTKAESTAITLQTQLC